MTSVAINTQAIPKAVPRSAPPVKVVRGGRYGLGKARQLAANVLRVLAVSLVLGLVVSVVYSQAKITELNGQINQTRTELTAAQSEYDYLSAQMSNITTRSSVQDVAQSELGMVKADPSQITYIQLEDESIIEKTAGEGAKLLENVRTAALNLLSSLNP